MDVGLLFDTPYDVWWRLVVLLHVPRVDRCAYRDNRGPGGAFRVRSWDSRHHHRDYLRRLGHVDAGLVRFQSGGDRGPLCRRVDRKRDRQQLRQCLSRLGLAMDDRGYLLGAPGPLRVVGAPVSRRCGHVPTEDGRLRHAVGQPRLLRHRFLLRLLRSDGPYRPPASEDRRRVGRRSVEVRHSRGVYLVLAWIRLRCGVAGVETREGDGRGGDDDHWQCGSLRVLRYCHGRLDDVARGRCETWLRILSPQRRGEVAAQVLGACAVELVGREPNVRSERTRGELGRVLCDHRECREVCRRPSHIERPRTRRIARRGVGGSRRGG
mmetsp:Transcript_47129/g.135791  ORF Transcript_47129/g.135791 Transcript_47129/m.135791 type:complete len:323 (+) Transcript_47129:2231-3199(+)